MILFGIYLVSPSAHILLRRKNSQSHQFVLTISRCASDRVYPEVIHIFVFRFLLHSKSHEDPAMDEDALITLSEELSAECASITRASRLQQERDEEEVEEYKNIPTGGQIAQMMYDEECRREEEEAMYKETGRHGGRETVLGHARRNGSASGDVLYAAWPQTR